MLVLGIVETVHRVVVRWSRWSSQTAGECNTENSCLRLDAPWKKTKKKQGKDLFVGGRVQRSPHYFIPRPEIDIKTDHCCILWDSVHDFAFWQEWTPWLKQFDLSISIQKGRLPCTTQNFTLVPVVTGRKSIVERRQSAGFYRFL